MSTSTYKKQETQFSSGEVPDIMAVFQECLQQFNASPINASRCRKLLAKLLRLLYHGETFPSQESTTLFFSISKLFQHKDVSLRQMVYLTIKELSATSQDILMVTSSIMKDIQSGDPIYKPNAIRTLSKVLDSSTVSASERLFKNAIVDKNPIVSSAALISSYNLYPQAKDVVKRYTNESLETIQSFKQFPANQFQLHEYYGNSTSNLPSTSYMYQYHALGLLFYLRNHDKMALMKLITTLSEGSFLKNSLSIIQLIRYMNKILLDDEALIQHLYPFLAGFLKHKSDMVELEACKCLLNLQHLLKDDQFMAIVTTLQKLLTVPRTSTRFGAVRLINKISSKHPEKIFVVNLELETLINDTNRSISTLAITTLLKTMGAGVVENGSEGGENVDRLISKMTSLMDDISEDFKIVIIEAIENLALKFPSKHKKLVTFLTELLRDEGSLSLKTNVVDVLFDLSKFLPDVSAKQLILMNFCEFIEDCEFTELLVRILHLLGEEGPSTSNPSFYIRHIYNRLVLENSIVRSSAIIALAKFAVICGGSVAENLKILLSRCLNDVDDEVRDRAALSLKFIEGNQKKLIVSDSKYDLSVLENKLTQYLNDESNFEHEFNISEVPTISKEEIKAIEFTQKISKLDESSNGSSNGSQDGPTSKEGKESNKDETSNDLLKQQIYSQELSVIPEFASFGSLTNSSRTPIYLTDKENDYVVTAVKHFFIDSKKCVLQYNITNTLPRSVLQDVSVIAQPDNELYQEDFIIPLAELRPDETGIVYVAFSAPSIEDEELLASFGSTIAYTNKDIIDDEGHVDPADEGWTDEYQIDDFDIQVGDFTQPAFSTNFTAIYDQLSNYESTVVTLSGVSGLESAVSKLISTLNLMPVEGSDYVPSDASSHVLKLFGKDLWGGKVAVRIRLAYSGGKVVTKTEAKGETSNFSSAVTGGVY